MDEKRNVFNNFPLFMKVVERNTFICEFFDLLKRLKKVPFSAFELSLKTDKQKKNGENSKRYLK